MINIDARDIPHLDRIQDTMAWLRISYPKEDEISEIKSDPAFYHIYYVPEIHNFAPKQEMYVKPERDPNYKCKGIHLRIHWAKGYVPIRYVRVAVTI